ncbi:hypothetical protein PENTCL1PPCAC_258, partial [Pristionchus entomophagus]
QLYYDGHNQLAQDLSDSIGMNNPPPPSDKLFRLVCTARKNADNDDDEEEVVDMPMSLNPVDLPINNLAIDGEYGDYFPFLGLPAHLKDLVFSFLP